MNAETFLLEKGFFPLASKSLEKLTELAESQIRDAKYIEGVKVATGAKETIGIAIGFRGKELKISYI